MKEKMKASKKAISLVLVMALVFAFAPAVIADAASATLRTVIGPQSVPYVTYTQIGDTIYAVFSNYREGVDGGISNVYNIKTGERHAALSNFTYVGRFFDGIAAATNGYYVREYYTDEDGDTWYDSTFVGKWGFIDTAGNIIVPFEYDDEGWFYEGLARVTIDDKYGYIDKSGNTVIPIVYDWISSYFDDDGIVKVEKDRKFGYVDKSGNVVIPIEYNYIGWFNDGIALAEKGDWDTGRKYGFIDRAGNTVIPFEYDRAYGFSEGLAPVSKDGKYGFIDTKGNVVIPFEYDDPRGFSEGLAAVSKDGKYGFIDTTGNVVIPFEYDGVYSFYNGIAEARKGDWDTGKWGIIDKSGNIVIPIEYDYIGGSNDGLFTVRKGDWDTGKWGVIDRAGNTVIPFEYDYLWWYYGYGVDTLQAQKNEKYGLIDKSGNLLIPLEYNYIGGFAAGLAIVRKGDWETGKYGVIDKAGNTVVPIEYNNLSAIWLTGNEIYYGTDNSIIAVTADGSEAPIDTAAITAFVTRLYSLVLDREPDRVGIEAWVARLSDKSWGGGAVAETFFFDPVHQEFKNRGLSNEEFLTIMYATFMDREPDEIGWPAWLDRMANQGYTWEDVFEGFVVSDEWGDRCDAAGIKR